MPCHCQGLREAEPLCVAHPRTGSRRQSPWPPCVSLSRRNIASKEACCQRLAEPDSPSVCIVSGSLRSRAMSSAVSPSMSASDASAPACAKNQPSETLWKCEKNPLAPPAECGLRVIFPSWQTGAAASAAWGRGYSRVHLRVVVSHINPWDVQRGTAHTPPAMSVSIHCARPTCAAQCSGDQPLIPPSSTLQPH